MITITEEFPGDNVIAISEDTISDFQGNIVINGRGNKVEIGRPQHCSDIFIEVCGNCTVEIGSNCILTGQHIRLFEAGTVTIGDGTAFNGHSVIHMHEGATVSIGKDCLIAGAVSFSTSHVHKILDRHTRKRLNHGGDVKIADRVWIGPEVSLWPGCDVSSDSVIGKGTYVSKAFPSHCIIAGSPAKVVREDIVWER